MHLYFYIIFHCLKLCELKQDFVEAQKIIRIYIFYIWGVGNRVMTVFTFAATEINDATTAFVEISASGAINRNRATDQGCHMVCFRTKKKTIWVNF
jgi:hypothetical protein